MTGDILSEKLICYSQWRKWIRAEMHHICTLQLISPQFFKGLKNSTTIWKAKGTGTNQLIYNSFKEEMNGLYFASSNTRVE